MKRWMYFSFRCDAAGRSEVSSSLTDLLLDEDLRSLIAQLPEPSQPQTDDASPSSTFLLVHSEKARIVEVKMLVMLGSCQATFRDLGLVCGL